MVQIKKAIEVVLKLVTNADIQRARRDNLIAMTCCP